MADVPRGKAETFDESASSPAACRRKQAEFTHAHNLAGWPCIATGASDRGEISPKSHSQNRAISLEKKSMGLPTGKRRRCRSRSRSVQSVQFCTMESSLYLSSITHTLSECGPLPRGHTIDSNTLLQTHTYKHTQHSFHTGNPMDSSLFKDQ